MKCLYAAREAEATLALPFWVGIKLSSSSIFVFYFSEVFAKAKVKLRCCTVKLLRSEVTHKARSEVVRFAHNGFITIIHLRPLGRKLHYP